MNRRNLLIGSAGLAASVGAGWWKRNELTRWYLTRNTGDAKAFTTAAAIDGSACVLTSEQIEGPYFIKGPMRSNIKEDRQGVSLSVELTIVDARSCQPISDALVSIWHCDAAGRYILAMMKR